MKALKYETIFCIFKCCLFRPPGLRATKMCGCQKTRQCYSLQIQTGKKTKSLPWENHDFSQVRKKREALFGEGEELNVLVQIRSALKALPLWQKNG